MKRKIINKLVVQAIYCCSYLYLPFNKKIREQNRFVKMKQLFINVQALKELRKCANMLSKNKIHFLLYEAPDEHKIVGLSKEELQVLNKQWTSGQLLNHDDYLKIAYHNNRKCYEFAKTRYKGTKLISNGIYIQSADYSGEFYNVKDGIRKTFFQPDKYNHSIHIYGSCIARGFGVSDEFTIPSYLQNDINMVYSDSYMVINYGTGGKAGYEGIMNDIKYILSTKFQEEDIVILMTYHTFSSELYKKVLKDRYYECSSLFNSPHPFGWWFLNSTIHLNDVGNKVISKYIFDVLEDRLLLNSISCNKVNHKALTKQTYYANHRELNQYLKYLKQFKVKGREKKIGCIVMNCNPFTYGHKYLIQQALTMVDYLYVFVVEENRSFFTFEDRFKMVRDGTKEFDHLTVLPSGQFMISSLTFPEYFEKEEKQDVTIDATNDLKIFGEKIAPILNITKRFAGEEPIDVITRQYNNAMEEQLKTFGIEFICIPRLKHDNFFISASIVREKMKLNRIDELRELVPSTTFSALGKYIEQMKLNNPHIPIGS